MTDLERAGFQNRGGNASHRNFVHPSGVRVIISGTPGKDALPYQEKRCKTRLAMQNQGGESMNDEMKNVKYSLVVEWSAEDGQWLGLCPELFHGGVHGPDRETVFRELCEVVDEVLKDAKETGIPLLAPRKEAVDAA